MKKIMSNPIFTFILGAIIFGGIGTALAYSSVANDVGYTPKDTTWEVDNVKDAVDDLYTKLSESKKLILIEDHFQLDSTHFETYTKKIDVSNYTDYKNFTKDDFYLVINGIRPSNNEGPNVVNLVNFIKEYDSNSGILTITSPYENYGYVGVWSDLSVYLYTNSNKTNNK